MKKRKGCGIALVLMLALAIGAGCCERQAADGTVTKSFGNCLANIVDFGEEIEEILCTPPANVMALVNAVAPAVAMAVNLAFPQTVDYFNAANAANTVNSIQQGLCVGAGQVTALIAFLQSEFFAEAAAKVVNAEKRMVAVDTKPLEDWVKKGR